MLRLVDIKKDYVMKDQESVHALKGVSLNFRRNEFVAILGPSGCGKTTLLNITGGLDRYTSGDLVINGKSTKDYDDSDWDTYRNHSIGFVFQSYNLIPHQSILKNVELSLTISGIDKEERKRRAMTALERVGLKGLERKKPNQLSGGQMQRVAIARALINNPEIVLADEPTGALDSETSIQIMDLLKEVAKDCLVIMVTHNPDLANEYATRIVNMKDGLIIADSNPYTEEEEKAEPRFEKKENKGNKKKSSMSFITATALSFSNLVSKLKRTILIAVAGSIGIIGVSSVLAVSQGVRSYVGNMQDDMLSQYPLSISETSVDITSLLTGLSNWDAKKIIEFNPTTSVGLDSLINYLMDKYKDITNVKTNDINKELLAYIDQIDPKYLNCIMEDYGVDVTNNIFASWQRHDDSEVQHISLNGLTQMYISSLSTVQGFGEYASFVDLFTDFMDELPNDTDFILSQYDLIGPSKMATEENQIMFVVDDNQTLTDLIYAQMGYFTQDEFLALSKKAIADNDKSKSSEEESTSEEESYPYPTSFTFEDIIGKEYYYIPDIYDYKNTNVGANVTFTMTLPASLFGGTSGNDIDLLFDFSYNTMTSQLEGTIGIQGLSINATMTPQNQIDQDKPWLNDWTANVTMFPAFSGGIFTFKEDGYVDLSFADSLLASTQYEAKEKVVSGYTYNAIMEDDPSDKIDLSKAIKLEVAGILKKKKNVNFGSLSRGVYYTNGFTKRFIKDAIKTKAVTSKTVSEPGIEYYIEHPNLGDYNAYVTYKYTSFKDGDGHEIDGVNGIAMSLNSDMRTSLGNMFSISGGITGTSKNQIYLRSMAGQSSKFKDNRYVFETLPKTISIYPKDFASKDKITSHLDKWNKEGDITVIVDGTPVTRSLEERNELTYIDTVALIIRVINTLIQAITIALVAFTSLSLVVSCFMIAVITYISTMERIKEIGVIRSLGGRKKDVSRLFIAECLITGLTSGVFGILTTYLLAAIFNLSIIQFGVGNMAILTPLVAIIMIGISIFLNVISGLIPAMRASNQDPVIALRSE